MIHPPLSLLVLVGLLANHEAMAQNTIKSQATLTQDASLNNIKQQLLDKVSLGEATYKEELIVQALQRLDAIAPNDPQVIAAHVRLSLRQGKAQLADQQLEQLKKVAPDSLIYRQTVLNKQLTSPEMQRELQKARILVMGGKLPEAKKAYDAIFHGNLPTTELAAEYWILVSRIPKLNQQAYAALKALYQSEQSDKMIATDLNTQRVQNSIRHALSNLLIDEGDSDLKSGNIAVARTKFEEAFRLEPTNTGALIGLGDVAFKQENYVQAEKAYKDALLMEGKIASYWKISAYYGLTAIYKKQSSQKALDYTNSLPQDIQDRMKAYISNIKGNLIQEQSDTFQQQAKALQQTKHWAQSVERYQKALKLTPNDVWLTYQLANALVHTGQTQQAKTIFKQLALKEPRNPQQVYAYALFLSSIKRNQEALSHLNTLPKQAWTKDMRDLALRVRTDFALTHAQALRDQGKVKEANAYLEQVPQSIQVILKRADWALEDGQYTFALINYKKAKAQEPNNFTALMGEIESYVATKQFKQARASLNALTYQARGENFNAQRRIALAWAAVGEPQKALSLLQGVKRIARKGPANQDKALVFRDAAIIEQQQNLNQLAKEDYRQAMVSSGITPVLPPNNEVYTFLTRDKATDDWLKRSIRSGAGTLYRQQDPQFTLDQDYWRLQGTKGISDFTAKDTIAQLDFPLFNGRGFIRDDYIDLNSGQFATTNGIHFENFGTCGVLGCSTGLSQSARGDSFSFGWHNEAWILDIGSSPLGFNVVNALGGLGYSSNFQHINWTLLASRRNLTNSLLSFAGTKDPNTGIVWGGVLASGLNLSMSYDRGNAHGFWSNMELSSLNGTHVANNYRARLMDGYYFKLINDENRRATIGINNMLWHYQKDLGGYTLGQGGYYSPQLYLSFGLPIDYRQRTDNWSFEIGAVGSWSTATIHSSLPFPLTNNLPQAVLNENTSQENNASPGLGYIFLFVVERRLTTHFFLGAGVDIQRSRDYTPSHAFLYLRHSWDGWQGSLDSPPHPLRPFADYR